MSLRVRVVVGKEDQGSFGVLQYWKYFRRHSSATPLFRYARSRHCEEFLPNAQLQKLREENLGDKNLVRSKLARRDRLVVLDALGRVNQNCRRIFCDRVGLTPLCEDFAVGSGGVTF